MFAILIEETTPLANEHTLLTTVYVTIGLSILLHGLTASPFAARYASWFESHPIDAPPALEPGRDPHSLATLGGAREPEVELMATVSDGPRAFHLMTKPAGASATSTARTASSSQRRCCIREAASRWPTSCSTPTSGS